MTEILDTENQNNPNEIISEDELTYEEQLNRVLKINEEQKENFEKVPVKDKILFVSHCVRKDLYERVQQISSELGYRLVKAGGGSIVRKTMLKDRPKAVIGVACYREIEEIIDAIKIPYMTVMLNKDTCKDTEFDFDELERILKLFPPAE